MIHDVPNVVTCQLQKVELVTSWGLEFLTGGMGLDFGTWEWWPLLTY
jgi:hypothetical protein